MRACLVVAIAFTGDGAEKDQVNLRKGGEGGGEKDINSYGQHADTTSVQFAGEEEKRFGETWQVLIKASPMVGMVLLLPTHATRLQLVRLLSPAKMGKKTHQRKSRFT